MNVDVHDWTAMQTKKLNLKQRSYESLFYLNKSLNDSIDENKDKTVER